MPVESSSAPERLVELFTAERQEVDAWAAFYQQYSAVVETEIASLQTGLPLAVGSLASVWAVSTPDAWRMLNEMQETYAERIRTYRTFLDSLAAPEIEAADCFAMGKAIDCLRQGAVNQEHMSYLQQVDDLGPDALVGIWGTQENNDLLLEDFTRIVDSLRPSIGPPTENCEED